MKRLTLFLLISMSFQLLAQEKPLISSAIIASRSGDLAEAKKYLDEAESIINTKDPSEISPKTLGKFYFNNGDINFKIHNSQDPAIKALEPNALDRAAENLSKLIEYEKSIGKKKFTKDAMNLMPYIAQAYAQRAIDKDKEKDYVGSYQDFQKTYDLKKATSGQVDTAMLYNTALLAQKAKLYDKAISINEQLIEMGYRGMEYKATDVTTQQEVAFNSARQRDLAVKAGTHQDPKNEGDLRPDIFLATANLLKLNGDTAQYDEYIKKGRVKFPDNEALIRAELQKFLETKQFDKAMVNLDLAISKDPQSKLLYYIKGNILQTSMKDMDGARAAYAKAIEIDENYTDPIYMSGLIHIDAANAYTEKMNALSLNENKKYKELQAKQKTEFEQALPYFEKVYAINAKDLDTLRALKEVYYKLKMREKQMKIMQEIAALEGGK